MQCFSEAVGSTEQLRITKQLSTGHKRNVQLLEGIRHYCADSAILNTAGI